MTLDLILSDETEKIPRQAVGGLLLLMMLASLDIIGLGRIAGPFAALIAGTVFLTRGERIFTRLTELSDTGTVTTSSVPNSRLGTLPLK